jgi:hypothetical protein
MFNRLFVLFAILTLSACSDPKALPLPPDLEKLSQDQTFIDQIKTLEQSDKDLLAGFMARAAIGQALSGSGGIPLGMTVGEAIENQKAWVAKMQAEEAEAEKIRQAAIAKSNQIAEEIKNTLKVIFVKMGEPSRQNYKTQLPIKFEVINSSEKSISGYKARIEFVDMFGQIVKKLSIEDSQGLAPKATEQPIFVWDYNQFDDDMVKLVNLSDDKYKASITVTHIVFTDGEQLQLDL